MEKPQASLRGLHRNNNARSRGRNVTFENPHNTEIDERLAKKKIRIDKKLMDPYNMRLFTAEGLLPPPHWENVMRHDPNQSFPKRDPPEGATAEQKAQYEYAVSLGQNIARWHQENKPVVIEYLLFLKDENLNMVKPQYSAIIRKCSRKTKCYILITNRILNRQVGKFKWIKYLIVQIQGPDYTMVKVCNTMLERWFPEYKKRVEYNKQRYKFGIYTSESIVDNADLYFPYQRSGKCSTNFGDLPCETPYGASDKQHALDAPWKANNRMFMEGNLLPSNTAVKTAQSYVYAYHPLGARDKFEFRSMFGIKEPPAGFQMRDNIGYPTSNVCGPDFKDHPMYYDKGNDVNEEEKPGPEQDGPTGDFIDPEKLILEDEDEKAQFKVMKMRLIMDRRRSWIGGNQNLAVPFPHALLPTGSLAMDAAGAGKTTGEAAQKVKKPKKKPKPESVKHKLILINEDNIFVEYCYERDHLKRNPIVPYPRLLVPGKELAEAVRPKRITIDPIKSGANFVDRREELMKRFRELFHGAENEPETQKRRPETAPRKHTGDAIGRVAEGEQPNELAAGITPVTFAMFKAKVESDAKKLGMKRSNLFGKKKIEASTIHGIVPEWRHLATKEESIYNLVLHRVQLEAARLAQDHSVKKLMKHENRVLDNVDWAENHTATFVAGAVRKPKVTPKLPLFEGGPDRTAAVVDELLKQYTSEKESQHGLGEKKTYVESSTE